MLWPVRLSSNDLQHIDERWNADDNGQQLRRPRLLRVLRVLLLNAREPRRRGQELDKRLARLKTYFTTPRASTCGRDDGFRNDWVILLLRLASLNLKRCFDGFKRMLSSGSNEIDSPLIALHDDFLPNERYF